MIFTKAGHNFFVSRSQQRFEASGTKNFLHAKNLFFNLKISFGRTKQPFSGGRDRTRTCDNRDVNAVLYQLSYATMHPF